MANNKNINKNNLDARVRAYEKSLSGTTVRGMRTSAVSPLAFHKPGSNKK